MFALHDLKRLGAKSSGEKNAWAFYCCRDLPAALAERRQSDVVSLGVQLARPLFPAAQDVQHLSFDVYL